MYTSNLSHLVECRQFIYQAQAVSLKRTGVGLFKHLLFQSLVFSQPALLPKWLSDVSIFGGRKVQIGCYSHIPLPPLLAAPPATAAKRKMVDATKAASYSFVHQQLNASSLRSPALVEMEDATEAALNKSHRVRLQ